MKKNTLRTLFFLVAMHTAGNSAEATIIAQVQTFLNGIQSLVAEFMQTNPDKHKVKGKIWLKRDPNKSGKMRLDYQDPSSPHVIAAEDELNVYDSTDNSRSHYNLDRMPAAFILGPKIDLSKDVTVESCRKTAEYIEVVLVPKGDSSGQSLTLYFSVYANGNIKGLIKWVVKDPQGNQTLVEFSPGSVSLNDPKLVPDNLFNP